jgi:hypothetical protein
MKQNSTSNNIIYSILTKVAEKAFDRHLLENYRFDLQSSLSASKDVVNISNMTELRSIDQLLFHEGKLIPDDQSINLSDI